MKKLRDIHGKVRARLYYGKCLNVLRELPDNSVDSIVTDPPYGISFMGKKVGLRCA